MATIKGRYLAYMLRIWQDNDAGKMAWRASLENAHTGERRGFASLEALITFLREQIRISNHEGRLGRRGKRVSLKSPVRQIRTPGSVRGPSGNWQTYRNGGTDRGNSLGLSFDIPLGNEAGRRRKVSTAHTVREVVERVVLGTATEREKAIALHDYVRDHVKFGFTKYFDAAQPDYTLACGFGHCNPKSRLMVALFRAAGLESYEHFAVIPNDILKGAFPASRSWLLSLCPQLCHAYVEVKVEGAWCAVDSYSIDTPLLEAAQARLAEEGRSLGYGTRVDATNVWDGRSDAFSQFQQGMMVEDHGRVDDLEAYFRSRKYRHQVLGVRFNTVFKLMGDFSVAPINSHVERIRMAAETPVPLASLHR